MISIDKATAERIYDLYNNVEAADAHYKRCQSDNFRVHVKSVYQNEGVKQAFETLKQRIEADTPTTSAKTAGNGDYSAPQRQSRSILDK